MEKTADATGEDDPYDDPFGDDTAFAVADN